jgi:hypothetical protein
VTKLERLPILSGSGRLAAARIYDDADPPVGPQM